MAHSDCASHRRQVLRVTKTMNCALRPPIGRTTPQACVSPSSPIPTMLKIAQLDSFAIELADQFWPGPMLLIATPEVGLTANFSSNVVIVNVLKHPVLKEIAIKDFADNVALYLTDDSLVGGRTMTIDVRAK